MGSGSRGVSRRSPSSTSPPDFLGCCSEESVAQSVSESYHRNDHRRGSPPEEGTGLPVYPPCRPLHDVCNAVGKFPDMRSWLYIGPALRMTAIVSSLNLAFIFPELLDSFPP